MAWKDGSRPEALDNVWDLYKTKIPGIIEANKRLSEQFSNSGIDFTDQLIDKLFTNNQAGDLAGLTPEQTAAVLGMRNQGTQSIISGLQSANAGQFQKMSLAQQGASSLNDLASNLSQMEVQNRLNEQAQILQEILAGLKEREVINAEKTGEVNRAATSAGVAQRWENLRIKKEDTRSQISARKRQLDIEETNADTNRMSVISQNERRGEQTKIDWERVGINKNKFASDNWYRKQNLQIMRDQLAEQIRATKKAESFKQIDADRAWQRYNQLKKMEELAHDLEIEKFNYMKSKDTKDRDLAKERYEFEKDMQEKKFDYYKTVTDEKRVREGRQLESDLATGRFNRMKLSKQIAHIDDYYQLAKLDSETKNNLSKIRLKEIEEAKKQTAEKLTKDLSVSTGKEPKEFLKYVQKLAELQSKAVATTVDEYNLKQKEAYASAFNMLVPEQLGKMIAYYDGDFVPIELPTNLMVEIEEGHPEKLTKTLIYKYAKKEGTSVANLLGYLINKKYVYPSVEE